MVAFRPIKAGSEASSVSLEGDVMGLTRTCPSCRSRCWEEGGYPRHVSLNTKPYRTIVKTHLEPCLTLALCQRPRNLEYRPPGLFPPCQPIKIERLEVDPAVLEYDHGVELIIGKFTWVEET
jgi:hypothetical protein